MAIARFPPIDFPDIDYNVFGVSRRFTPPFYINTLQGVYDKEERMSYSAGQVFVILHKVKIKSVITTVRGVSLKIPVDYKGKFSIGGHHRGPLNLNEIRELFDIETHNAEVRISDSDHHGKHFMDVIDKIGPGVRTCNLKLIEETEDEYYIGRSLNGATMVIFSTEANLMLQAKEANAEDTQSLIFHVEDLKHDVFVTDVGGPAIKFFTTNEVISSPPCRPPKPKPTVKPRVKPLTSITSTGEPDLNKERDAHKNVAILYKERHEVVEKPDSEELKQDTSPNRIIDQSRPYPALLPKSYPDQVTAQTSPIVPPKHNPDQDKSQPSPTLPPKRYHNRDKSQPSPTLPPKRIHDQDRFQPPAISKQKYSKSVDDLSTIGTHFFGQNGEQSGVASDSSISEKSPPNPRKQSSRRHDKEFIQSFQQGKDVQVILSSDQPPLPPKKKAITLGRRIPPPIPLHPYQSDNEEEGYDSDDGSDYEPPISNGEDYEKVEEPTPIPDDIRRRYDFLPSSPKSPSSPNSPKSIKRMFSIREQLNLQIRKKFSKLNKSRKQSSGDMADDEMTEGPYADQQEAQHKTFRKRQTRNRNDPLPLPAAEGLPPSTISPAASPLSSPVYKAPLAAPYPTSDSSSGSDYERIDDKTDAVSASRRPPMDSPRMPPPPPRSPITSNPQLSEVPFPGVDLKPFPGQAFKPLPGRDLKPLPQSPVAGNPQLSGVLFPGQAFKPSPGQDLKPFPGQASKPLPGQAFKPLPGRDFKPLSQSPIASNPQLSDVSFPGEESSSRRYNVAVVQPTQAPVSPVDLHEERYQFPKDLSNARMEAIAKTLQHLKIPDEVIETFKEAQIDGQIFVCLDDSMLEELGVKRFHRMKIIRFKNGWRPNLD